MNDNNRIGQCVIRGHSSIYHCSQCSFQLGFVTGTCFCLSWSGCVDLVSVDLLRHGSMRHVLARQGNQPISFPAKVISYISLPPPKRLLATQRNSHELARKNYCGLSHMYLPEKNQSISLPHISYIYISFPKKTELISLLHKVIGYISFPKKTELISLLHKVISYISFPKKTELISLLQKVIS